MYSMGDGADKVSIKVSFRGCDRVTVDKHCIHCERVW